MSQPAGKKAGVENIRTLVLSGALDDLRLSLNSPDEAERQEYFRRFERATSKVNWRALHNELRDVIQGAQS